MATARRRFPPLVPILLLAVVSPTFLFFVSRLHRSWSPPATPTVAQRKMDHVVLGPAAGEGRADRLQCEGLYALNINSSKRNANAGEGISFVTVFTIYNTIPNSDSSGADRKETGAVVDGKPGRSMAILWAFVNFLQVSMPKSNVIILTDPASKFPVNEASTSILPIEGNYSRGNLMLQRIKSYIAFLEKKLMELQTVKVSNHFIFTDSDIAVVDDLGDIFRKYPHAHLALTFRNNKNQPLNSGFIAVRGSPDGISKAVSFLKDVYDAYTSKFLQASRMLGDQLALAWVIKTHVPSALNNFRKHDMFIGEYKGASILFLPCAVYNWTPPEGAGQFHGMPLDVKVVHFKGSRKRLMLQSWRFYNSTSNMSNMLCLILRSGRTKYDF